MLLVMVCVAVPARASAAEPDRGPTASAVFTVGYL